MVSALDRKLARDLWRLRMQLLTISLVMACGVASLVAMRSAYDSLRSACDDWYARARFADVFASVRRAPRSLVSRIGAIPGVVVVDARVVESVTLDMPGMSDLVAARVVSLPRYGSPALNELHLRAGRLPEASHASEVLVHEAFASAWGLRPGDGITAVLNGRRQTLRVTGVALSPEFVYALQPGAFVPDDRRYGVLWMNLSALEVAFQMEGAFNDLQIRLERGASEPRVVADLDRALDPYGSLGAYGRERHPSARWIEQKIVGLRGQATITPLLFLAVAALLVNMVLSRLLNLEREQIATLKALGYDDGAIVRHYLTHALATSLAGAIIGVALGAWAGRGLVSVYSDFYRFPVLAFRPSGSTVVLGAVSSAVASMAGAIQSVRNAVRVPPAEAMRPEAPPRFRPTWLERAGVHRNLPSAVRMVLRELERRPGRAALSALGISFAAAVLVTGRFSLDSLDVVLDLQFNRAQSDDVTVTFVRPLPLRAAQELARLPGVMRVEPQRTAGVRFRNGVRVREAALLGLPQGATLRRVFDVHGRRWEPPAGALLLGAELATRLGARTGDTLTVEDVEGVLAPREVRVAAVVDDMLGLVAYTELTSLHRLQRDGGRITGAALRIDPSHREDVMRRLKALPAVADSARRTAAIDFFRYQTTRMSALISLILAAFASVIAVGVVYNNARIALSVRSRELATLRVLGFTLGEVSAVLFGEQAVQVAVALPVGLALGHGLAALVLRSIDTEVFRMPLSISHATYAFAAGVVVTSSVASALIVRRRVDALDMVSVLKSRD